MSGQFQAPTTSSAGHCDIIFIISIS